MQFAKVEKKVKRIPSGRGPRGRKWNFPPFKPGAPDQWNVMHAGVLVIRANWLASVTLIMRGSLRNETFPLDWIERKLELGFKDMEDTFLFKRIVAEESSVTFHFHYTQGMISNFRRRRPLLFRALPAQAERVVDAYDFTCV